jgi:hypothetical protein
MGHDTVGERRLTRFVRIVLYAAILVGLLVGGLVLFEGGGSSPARPLGGQNISNSRNAVPANGATTATDNPNGNGGCKHLPMPPPNCRPPSGG